MPRRLVRLLPRAALVALVVVALAPVPGASGADERDTHTRYVAPVRGEVRRGYEAPSSTYGPGHRGVDLAAAPGAVVRAAGAGVVVHAGAVAGTTWVSIDHPGGVRTAYGPLARVRVAVGQRVAATQVIGALASGGHGHHGGDRGLHFSVRRHGTYLDPLGLLAGSGTPSLRGPGGTSPLSGGVVHGAGSGAVPARERGATAPAPRPAASREPGPERLAVAGPPSTR